MRLSSLLLPLLLLVTLATPAVADEFGLVVSDVNAFFKLHRDDFRLQVAAEFGVPVTRVDRLVATLGSAGDAYLCLQVSRDSGRDLNEVSHTWQRHHKRGWGAIAQEFGIKPGSDAFQKLKHHQLREKRREHERYRDDDGHKGDKDKGKSKDKKKDR